MSPEPSEPPAWWENRQRKIPFDEKDFDAFVEMAGQDLARGREFAVVISSDDALRKANTRFRSKRATTDVLSFPDGEDGRLGDILISAGRAQRQAIELGHSIEEELKTLLIHGLLHLLGYDHETDQGRMRRAERRWCRKYGLSPGLTMRAEP